MNKIIAETNIQELFINKDGFQSFFYVSDWITIHSSQRETFTEPDTIHDWNRLIDKHHRYVALTTSSNIAYINM